MMGVYFKVEEYHRPQDLLEAVDLLTKFENNARVIEAEASSDNTMEAI